MADDVMAEYAGRMRNYLQDKQTLRGFQPIIDVVHQMNDALHDIEAIELNVDQTPETRMHDMADRAREALKVAKEILR
jgi:hypothetical protein